MLLLCLAFPSQHIHDSFGERSHDGKDILMLYLLLGHTNHGDLVKYVNSLF